MKLRTILGRLMLLALAGPALGQITVYQMPITNPGKYPNATISATSLNATTVGAGMCFLAPKTGTITKVGIYQTAAKTGTPGTARVGIQGIATRVPDGTYKNSGTAYYDNTSWLASAGWQWFTLAATASVTVGDPLSAVIIPTSGSWDASNLVSVYAAGAVPVMATNYEPWTATRSASAWTAVGKTPCMGVMYSDGSVVGDTLPMGGGITADTTWGTGNAPLFRGTMWTPSYRCRACGVYVVMRAAATFTFKVDLFTGAGVSPTVYTTIDPATGVGAVGAVSVHYFPLPPTVLTPGTVYRFVIEPTAAVSPTTFFHVLCPDLVSLQAFQGELVGTTGTSGSPPTWTDYNTGTFAGYPVVPVIDQIILPTCPAIGNVLTGSGTYGDGGTQYTPTLTLPLAGNVLTGSGLFGNPGSQVTPTLTLPTAGSVLTGSGPFGNPGSQVTPSLTLPTAGNVLTGAGAFGDPGSPVTPSLTLPLAGNVLSGSGLFGNPVSQVTPMLTLPTAGSVLSGSGLFGNPGSQVTPTLTLPTAGNVLTGAGAFGDPGSPLTPSLTLPLAGNVLSGSGLFGNPVSQVTPTLTLPAAGNVLSGSGAFGNPGSQVTPSLTLPLAGNVLTGSGVFGNPLSQVTPTLTLPADSDVWYAVTNWGNPGARHTGSKRASSIANCSAGNIKSGMTIDDVLGTYAGGLDWPEPFWFGR